jgi:hypothetical protein
VLDNVGRVRVKRESDGLESGGEMRMGSCGLCLCV